MEVPHAPPLLHYDSLLQRGKAAFTVLPSGPAHSEAEKKLKVFSSLWLAMAKVSEILAGLSTLSWQPKAEAASRTHNRWIVPRRVWSSPCSRAGDHGPAVHALLVPYSWMSSRTQPLPHWEEGTCPPLFTKSKLSSQNQHVLSLMSFIEVKKRSNLFWTCANGNQYEAQKNHSECWHLGVAEQEVLSQHLGKDYNFLHCTTSFMKPFPCLTSLEQ